MYHDNDEELMYCPQCEVQTLSVDWVNNGYARCQNEDCRYKGHVTACETENNCLNVTKGRGEVYVCPDCIDLLS